MSFRYIPSDDYRVIGKTITEVASSVISYVGEAETSSTETTEAKWRISRIEIQGSQTITRYANDRQFNAVWDSRATYFPEIPFTNTESMSFDGVNDFLAIDMAALISSLSTNYSVSCWFKVTSFAGSPCMFSVASSSSATPFKVRMFVSATGKVTFDLRDDISVQVIASGVTTVSTATWYHAVAVRSGNNFVIYLNAVSDGTATGTIGTITNNVVSIGQFRRNTSSLFWPGNIDEVSVWNTALTPTEVSSIYNASNPNNLLDHSASANLIAWWRMGDDADDGFPTIIDVSTNTYHATMTNMLSTNIVVDAP